MLGTIVNSVAVIIGSIVGLIVKDRMNEKISNTIMSGLGLCVIYIGISGALEIENSLIMVISIAMGALIGEIIDIDKALSNLGIIIEKKIKKREVTFLLQKHM